MDRWQFLSQMPPPPGEQVLHKQGGVRLYDGDSRSSFDDSYIDLTSHRMVVKEHNMGLDLFRVISIEKEEGGFMRSDKIIVKMHPLSDREEVVERPVKKQKENFIKLSFRSGGQTEFYKYLQSSLQERAWVPKPAQVRGPVKREIRAGITGIEKKMSQKVKQDNANISQAFQDLDQLMEMAKPMVKLAKSISTKIRDKQGEITEDETVQFKSYLLSLGIDDPITKDSAGSDKKYYQGLAKEMFLILDQPIQDAGGMMTLTDAFVRVNRARGLELVSPDDILLACQSLKDVSLPMSLHTFGSGVMVLRTSNHSEEEVTQNLMNQLESVGSFTPEEMSTSLGLSVILAKERLLSAEGEGLLCRDDSVEGLRFYPNRFLMEE
jgi:ESCRT-II complex subunit VPS36